MVTWTETTCNESDRIHAERGDLVILEGRTDLDNTPGELHMMRVWGTPDGTPVLRDERDTLPAADEESCGHWIWTQPESENQ